MVYPFVIPFDVALLLIVFLQWHTITIKECHGHFSCRWIVLQSLAQSSRSAQKKHRHHNSFGVHAWQNSNHLGWIELTQFMGFWIICRYFWLCDQYYTIFTGFSQDRGSIGPSSLQATPRRKLRPTAATFAVEEPESEPVKRRKCPREVQARFEIHLPAVGRKKNAFNHFHHPISNKTHSTVLNKRITRGDKIADWQILYWELHSHWLFAVCRFFNISVVATGEWRRWCFTARTDWKDSTALLQWSPHVSIYSGWVPVLNFQLWHFLSGKQDRSCRPSMSCFVFMFDKSSLGLARCSLNQGQTRWRFGGVEEQDDGSEGEGDDANWMQTTSLEFTCRPAPIAQQTTTPTNIPPRFLDTKKAPRGLFDRHAFTLYRGLPCSVRGILYLSGKSDGVNQIMLRMLGSC